MTLCSVNTYGKERRLLKFVAAFCDRKLFFDILYCSSINAGVIPAFKDNQRKEFRLHLINLFQDYAHPVKCK